TFERRLKEILIGDVRLIINCAKFFKDGKRNLPAQDFPPLNYGPRPKARINIVKGNRSFKDVIRGHQDQQSPKAQCIRIMEDNGLKSRLKCCWMGKAKNYHVLQNAWDIVRNNGLEECNVKYVGGLSLLFEWEIKEVASQSLEANSFWLQQWFEDLKLWEDNGEAVGRLTWLTIEGLPTLARNIGVVKSVLGSFGKILEVGRLDFKSKVLTPVKALLLTYKMGSLDQTLTVMLNDLVYSIRIFEERFHSDRLLPSPISKNTFDDGESAFEEEFIGPSMAVYDKEGDGFHGGDGSLPKETDMSFLGMSPRNLHRESVDDSPKDHSNSNSNIDKKHSLSPHDKYGGSVVGVTEVQSMANKKRKSKPKKKKLVVGTSTAHQTPSKEVFGEDSLSQNIMALIGFKFLSKPGSNVARSS
ncbi:hypothetical protein Tco_1468916, partial [Tanacetum coccineum]